ncbi:hypothetical protein Ddc_09872 [Ditylenchus destructor]|nr:hypothetical protein Ddc_09872 [Ditylenchus destructor]
MVSTGYFGIHETRRFGPNSALRLDRHDIIFEDYTFVIDQQTWVKRIYCDGFNQGDKFYCFEDMRQLLASYMRFKCTEIIIFDNSPYTTQHICSLKLISYIWKGQTLQLTDWSNNDQSSLNLIPEL